MESIADRKLISAFKMSARTSALPSAKEAVLAGLSARSLLLIPALSDSNLVLQVITEANENGTINIKTTVTRHSKIRVSSKM